MAGSPCKPKTIWGTFLKISACTPLNVENISSRRNSFGLGSHFCQQTEHISIKKMKRTDHLQGCQLFLENCACQILKSDISFIKLVNSLRTTDSRAKWEDYTKAWNYVKNDCDQETAKEYSTTVQIIVKDHRGKAISWRSVTCKMTCYHVSDEKNSINSISSSYTRPVLSNLLKLLS